MGINEATQIKQLDDTENPNAKRFRCLIPGLLKPDYLHVFIGMSGSRKTTTFGNLLMMLEPCFNNLYYCSPSILNDPKLKKIKFKSKKKTLQVITDPAKLESLVMRIMEQNEGLKYKDIESNLIVGDDLSGRKSLFKEESIFNIFQYNRRWQKTTIIYGAHALMRCPPYLRENCDAMSIMHLPGLKAVKQIIDEIYVDMDHKELRRILKKNVFEGSFITIYRRSGKIRRNLDDDLL